MTGFHLPELIIESLIRDGIQNVRADKTIIDSIFAQLTRAYNTRKYGSAEITKLKAMVDQEIPVLFSYHEVDTKSIAFTIMVGTDTEAKPRAHLGDHYEEIQEEIVDAERLEALIRVENMTVLSFDSTTGKVTVDPSTDLSPIYAGMIYVDSIGTEHDILSGISNQPGDKFFFVNKLDEVDFSLPNGIIKSSLAYDQYEIRGVTSDIQLVIGAHSKDALTTKYLYILLKYFLLSRKPDMIKRGLVVSSFSGSEFHRDQEFIGDRVFTRFLTITGKCDDTWRSDQVQLIDHIEIQATPVSCPDDE